MDIDYFSLKIWQNAWEIEMGNDRLLNQAIYFYIEGYFLKIFQA